MGTEFSAPRRASASAQLNPSNTASSPGAAMSDPSDPLITAVAPSTPKTSHESIAPVKISHESYKAMERLLRSDGWLTDVTINDYLELLESRDPKKVAVLSSGPVASLIKLERIEAEDQRLRRISESIKSSTVEMILVPINIEDLHWALCVFYVRKKKLLYYDSLSNSLMNLGNLSFLFRYWLKDDRSEPYEVETIKCESQKDKSACGVFTLANAERLSRDSSVLDYGQAHIASMRLQIFDQLHRKKAEPLEAIVMDQETFKEKAKRLLANFAPEENREVSTGTVELVSDTAPQQESNASISTSTSSPHHLESTSTTKIDGKIPEVLIPYLDPDREGHYLEPPENVEYDDLGRKGKIDSYAPPNKLYRRCPGKTKEENHYRTIINHNTKGCLSFLVEFDMLNDKGSYSRRWIDAVALNALDQPVKLQDYLRKVYVFARARWPPLRNKLTTDYVEYGKDSDFQKRMTEEFEVKKEALKKKEYAANKKNSKVKNLLGMGSGLETRQGQE